MTLGVMEQLDIEVEPLDSLFGIDQDQLPGAEDISANAWPTFASRGRRPPTGTRRSISCVNAAAAPASGC